MQAVAPKDKAPTVIFAGPTDSLPSVASSAQTGATVVLVEDQAALLQALNDNASVELIVVSEQLLGTNRGEFLNAVRELRAQTALIVYSSGPENMTRYFVRDPKRTVVFNKVGSLQTLATQVTSMLCRLSSAAPSHEAAASGGLA